MKRISPYKESNELLSLAEKLGFDAFQIKWTVQENSEDVKSFVKSINENNQELISGASGLQESPVWPVLWKNL